MSVLNNSNAIESGGYNIDRSLRFRSSASAYLSRTPASAGNRQTWTWSGWVKRGTLGVASGLFDAGSGGSTTDSIAFRPNDTLTIYFGNATAGDITTTQVFRDPSAWYHFVVALDTTQATASNRVKIYINGVQVTAFSAASYPAQNSSFAWNFTYAHNIGRKTSAVDYFDGYLAEVSFIDGQALTPSSFGQTDTVTGVWQPKKYTGTYGTNGFYLPFSDNTSATTLAYDKSGNGNNWTANNISTTAGATYDSMTDVPTLTSAAAANYCTLNPLDKYASMTVADGNLTATWTGNSTVVVRGTIALPSSGKYYWENLIAGTGQCMVGVGAANMTLISPTGTFVTYQEAGLKFVNGANSAYGASFGSGDTIGVAYDADANQITFYKNNASQGAIALTAGATYFPVVTCYNATIYSNLGQRPFSYTPPTGFKALNTFNLPDPTIKKPNQYMDAALSTSGGATGRTISSLNFQPDFLWDKPRSTINDHILANTVTGLSLDLTTNNTAAEVTRSNFYTAVNSTGFTIGNGDFASGSTCVTWCWKKGATPGFDIVTYNGTLTSAGTVDISHSLGIAPSMIITKARNGTSEWIVHHKSLTNWSYIISLNTTAAQSDTSIYGTVTAPTATTFRTNYVTGYNTNGTTYVAYLFAEIAGFSKFGSYTGNGSADGPFVYCGFRPRFVMIKRTNTAASWYMLDTSRGTYNVVNPYLLANASNGEATDLSWDVLSNGFKLRSTYSEINGSGDTMIFAAFAEFPTKYSLAR